MQAVTGRRARFVRDTVVAAAVLVVLYGALALALGPLAIPGYLLVVGFDLLEVAFGSAGGAYGVLFAAYLAGLSVLAAAAADAARTRTGDGSLPSWRLGTAGALGLVGTLSLLFGLAVLVGTSQLAPVAITGLAGAILLALAVWLAGGLER